MVELLSAITVKVNWSRPYRRFEGVFPDQFLLQNRDAPPRRAVAGEKLVLLAAAPLAGVSSVILVASVPENGRLVVRQDPAGRHHVADLPPPAPVGDEFIADDPVPPAPQRVV